MRSDTIAAIATAMSNSGIGIVRVSGEETFSIVNKIFRSKKKNFSLMDAESHTIHYGHIYDGDELIDEVIILLFRAPKSYTTEDTIEIDCHGGTYVLQRVLETLIKYGARPAEPGEFSKRAFLNGRMDLTQAEAVIDLIQSKNEFARKSSTKQLEGELYHLITDIRSKIIHQTAYIEAALDDPEHYDLTGYSEQLLPIVTEISNEIEKLLQTSDDGVRLKEGINTVIVGKPNAGKSSLMNSLVGKERAIVTNIAGTTRDIIEEEIRLDGITLNVIDTAGIRDTSDVVEKIGVDKSKQYLNDADLVIYVVDSSIPLDENDDEIIQMIQDKNVIVLLNKSDLNVVVTAEQMQEKVNHKIIPVSAKYQEGIKDITDAVVEMFFNGNLNYNDEVFITNARHKSALMDASESMKLVIQSIENGMPEDFFSIDLLNAYDSLGYIIGESLGEDLVNEIFSKFCMGK